MALKKKKKSIATKPTIPATLVDPQVAQESTLKEGSQDPVDGPLVDKTLSPAPEEIPQEREVISQEIMALVEIQYMGSSLEMKILKGNTLDLACCPWQILGPTQMALNFISQLCPARGWMEDMLFLDKSAFASKPSNQSLVIDGHEVVKLMEANGSIRGCPKEIVQIWDCGQLPLNTNRLPTRPNIFGGRILAEGPDWPRLDLPQPTQYLPSIWRHRKNSVPATLRQNIKDLQLCINKTEKIWLEIFEVFPKKLKYKEKKQRPIMANQTKRVCIINPFSMERNLTYRWSISPYAQLDRDKEMGPYLGGQEFPNEKIIRRISNLLLGQEPPQLATKEVSPKPAQTETKKTK